MKSFLYITLVSLLSFQACQHKASYKISGTIDIPVFEGKKVYLLYGGWENDFSQKDSAIVANGKYEFKGVVNKPEWGYITIEHPKGWQKSVHITLVVENENITIKTNHEGWTIIKGSALNDTHQNYQEVKCKLECQIKEIDEHLNTKQKTNAFTHSEKKALRLERYKLSKKIDSVEYEYIKNNINNPAFWDEISKVISQASLEEQKALVAAANERTIQLHVMQKLIERIPILEHTTIGSMFTDLHMNTPDGKPVALSDFAGKGKYVLIDFWASWCGPCRAEMPNVVAAYNKYKDKGFDIVGVSFDSKHDNWVKALDELHISWHQMSDLKGWDSAGAKAYAVTGIPHTVLLDPQGKIIARNICGEELQTKLAELLDK